MLLASVFYCSYSNAQQLNPTTPSVTQSTSDLLDPSAQNWTGQYGTGYWGGVSGGPNPNRLPTDTGFVWSYGNNAISTTIAINTALQQAGLQVEGYSYVWKVKNGNANVFTQQPGIDDFVITVDVYDSNGNIYQTYQYDYSYSHNWTAHTGTETFPDNFLYPNLFGSMVISAQGQDTGYWAGWYGPEFSVADSSITLQYSSNPCYNNELYDPACPGYAAAYYNQQCTANPLYDPGCPGYAQAYFTQQCNANPWYDPSCSGYGAALATCNANYHLNDSNCPNYATNTQNCQTNALYDSNCTGYTTAYNTCVANYHLNDAMCPNYTTNTQNCTTNALYDSNCTGYTTAYNTCNSTYHLSDSMCPNYSNNLATCAINPLTDTNCPGYATAYFNQQCNLNALYNTQCSNYQTALATCTSSYHLNDSMCPNYIQNTANCKINPLTDTNCPGYATAYYNQQCTNNALYDSGCVGYQTALNQCSTNPLYNTLCPSYQTSLAACTNNPLYATYCSGYQTAWNNACAANPLFDTQCPGYTTAVFTQQCNNNPKSDPQCPDYYVAMCEEDPLYDRGCMGYDVAYFDQQCGIDPQYDPDCVGYVDMNNSSSDIAQALDPTTADVLEDLGFDVTDTLTTSSTADTSTDIVQPEIVVNTTNNYESDATVFDTPIETVEGAATTLEDDIEKEIAQLESEAGSGETNMEDDIEAEIAALESEAKECDPDKEECAIEDNIEAEIAELENESQQADSTDGTAGTGEQAMEDDIEKEIAELKKQAAEQPEPVADPEQARRDKMKDIVASRATTLAEQMGDAANLQVQIDLQNRLLAMIGFVPDWGKKQPEIEGGELKDKVNLKGGRIVDHQFSRWFLNDAGFAAFEDLQYNLGAN